MKLITWNCQGAFRKKVDTILLHRPDILVIPECEHPDKLIFTSTTPQPNDRLWVGDNVHKGLGVFSYSHYKFQVHEQYNPALKFILPIVVTGGQFDFTLFAIWANNREDADGQYVEQIWKAIHHYEHLLNTEPAILAGDFNSNKIWDKPRRLGNHSAVVDKLAEKNIHSIYHGYLNQEQGKENDPTFFLYRNKAKPYHIDYCFSSAELYHKVKEVEIGKYEHWINYSDHTPLIVNFEE